MSKPLFGYSVEDKKPQILFISKRQECSDCIKTYLLVSSKYWTYLFVESLVSLEEHIVNMTAKHILESILRGFGSKN